MWFKGLLFLSYTALIITPTSAASHGQDGVAYNQQREALGPKHIPFIHRRQAWSNQTSTAAEVTSEAPPSPTTTPVVVSSEDESSDSPTSVTSPVVSSTPSNEVEPPATTGDGPPSSSSTPSEVRPSSVSISAPGEPSPSEIRASSVSTLAPGEPSSSQGQPPSEVPPSSEGRSSTFTSNEEPSPSEASSTAQPSDSVVSTVPGESRSTRATSVEPPSSASETDLTSQQESLPTSTPAPPTSNPPAPSSTQDQAPPSPSSTQDDVTPTTSRESSATSGQEEQSSTRAPEQPSSSSVQKDPASDAQPPSETESPSQTSVEPPPSSDVTEPGTIPASRTPSFFESLFPSISSVTIPVSEVSGLPTELPGLSDVPIPTGISLSGALSTGVESDPPVAPASTNSENVPVSETPGLIPSNLVPTGVVPSISVGISVGVSLPGASGTDSGPTPTGAASTDVGDVPASESLDVSTPILPTGVQLSLSLPIPTDSIDIPVSPTSGILSDILNDLSTDNPLPGLTSASGTASELVPTVTPTASPVVSALSTPTASLDNTDFSLLNPGTSLTDSETGGQATATPTGSLADTETSGQATVTPTGSLSEATSPSIVLTATASQQSGIPTSENTLGASGTATDGLTSLAPSSTDGISGAATGSSSAQVPGISVSTGSSANGDATIDLPTGTQRPKPSEVEPLPSSSLHIPSSTPDSDAKLDIEPSSTPSSTKPDSQSATTEGSTDPTGASSMSKGDPFSGTPTTLQTGNVAASKSSESPAETSTEAAGGEASGPPPPLSKSQTAGIAIGGTTCLLIALVAALFIARRYHSQHAAKRKSTGGVYPEVAYLYDPAVGRGNDDAEAGGGVPAMSGGAAGYGTVPRNSPEMPSAAARPSSVPSLNPFRDPIVPFPSPRHSPEPQHSPQMNEKGALLREMSHSAYGDIPITPHSPHVFNLYPPLSPYGRSRLTLPDGTGGPSDDASDLSSYRDSDPFADPFEHEIHLNVDPRTETPDSIMVVAPPPTPRGPYNNGRYSPAITHGSQTSLAHPTARYTPTADHASMRSCPHGKPTPETASLSARLPTVDTPSLSSRSSRSTGTSSPSLPAPPPRAASPPAIRKGWDDIKFGEPNVPAPLSLSNEPIERKPVPKRQEPALAGAGQLLLSGQGLPLTIKPSGFNRKNSKGLGLEVPPMGSVYGSSLSPAGDEKSTDHTVVAKRSAELLFARQSLVGKNF